MSGSSSQHDWRVDRREAGRHLPQQFGGSRLVFGDFAFRMEGSACADDGSELVTIGITSIDSDRKLGCDETKPGVEKKKCLISYRCGGKGHPSRLCPSAEDWQDVDEVGTEPSSDADSDLYNLDWGDDSITTINSVTERNDKTRGGKELLAFLTMRFQSQCVPSILWRRIPSRRVELVKGANVSHIKHYGQRRFRVKTSARSNIITTWEVADVRNPLTCQPYEKPRRQNGDSIPFERTGSLSSVRLWMTKSFHRQF